MTCEVSAHNATTDEITMTLIIYAYNFLWQNYFASVLPIVNMDSALSRVYDSFRFRRALSLYISSPFRATSTDTSRNVLM